MGERERKEVAIDGGGRFEVDGCERGLNPTEVEGAGEGGRGECAFDLEWLPKVGVGFGAGYIYNNVVGGFGAGYGGDGVVSADG